MYAGLSLGIPKSDLPPARDPRRCVIRFRSLDAALSFLDWMRLTPDADFDCSHRTGNVVTFYPAIN